MLRAFLILALIGLGNFAHAEDILPQSGVYQDSSLFKGVVTELRFGSNGLAEITRKCVELPCGGPVFEAFDVVVRLFKTAEITTTDDPTNRLSVYQAYIVDPKILWADAYKSQTLALKSKMGFCVTHFNGSKITLGLCVGKDGKQECTIMMLKN
jgi:hypothetical protein